MAQLRATPNFQDVMDTDEEDYANPSPWSWNPQFREEHHGYLPARLFRLMVVLQEAHCLHVGACGCVAASHNHTSSMQLQFFFIYLWSAQMCRVERLYHNADLFAGKRAISRAFKSARMRALALDININPLDVPWPRLQAAAVAAAMVSAVPRALQGYQYGCWLSATSQSHHGITGWSTSYIWSGLQFMDQSKQ